MKNRITSVEPKTAQWYSNQIRKNYLRQSNLNKSIDTATKNYIVGIYKNTELGLKLAQGLCKKKVYVEDYKALQKLYLQLVDLISQRALLKMERDKLTEERAKYYEQLRKQGN